MKDVITVATMRESDAHTIALYVPSRELMYRAAMGVYQAVNWQGKKVAIFTGSGNNGGDGYAAARLWRMDGGRSLVWELSGQPKGDAAVNRTLLGMGILADHSVPCCLYQVSEHYSEDGKYYYDQAVEKGVERKRFSEGEDLSRYDILVDCLLGTGFSGPVRGAFQQAIQAINRAKAYVVSVDINSGMNGDTGKGDLVVRSDLTVTIGYLKAGMFLGEAVWKVGRLVVADIGIRLVREDFFLATPEEMVFPRSGLSLQSSQVTMMTPGEAESVSKNGQTIPDVAQEIALRSQRLVRVLGKHSLVTDGYRTYFMEEGEYPAEIASLGEGERKE